MSRNMKKNLLLLLFSMFITSIQAQISKVSSIIISDETEKKVLVKLMDFHSDKNGKISKMKVAKAHLGTFKDEADYGPMWYGETIKVNQNGFLISWDFDKYDYMADRSKVSCQSNDWHSSEKLFIPFKKRECYRMYTCRFGGVPPSHGFANRHYEWDNSVKDLLELLKPYLNK